MKTGKSILGFKISWIRMSQCRSMVFSTIFAIANISCQSPYHNPNLTQLIPESEYHSLTAKYSDEKKIYDGFNQTMEISGTLLNSHVSQAQLDQKARIYQWNENQYKSQMEQMNSSLSKETKIFIGFFVPERKHDDLNKPKTLWKIFLDVGGKRYEGKAEKLKTIVADVKSLYPKHNRFYTPYVITFPVAVSQVENFVSKLTFTGPVGSTGLEFKALEK